MREINWLLESIEIPSLFNLSFKQASVKSNVFKPIKYYVLDAYLSTSTEGNKVEADNYKTPVFNFRKISYKTTIPKNLIV